MTGMPRIQSIGWSVVSRAIDAVIPPLEKILKRLDRWGDRCMRVAEQSYWRTGR